MNQNARLIEVKELQVALLNTGVQSINGAVNAYETKTQASISAAQKVLIDAKYRLTNTSMEEGVWYAQHFTKLGDARGIILRYIVREKAQTPRLSLGYFNPLSPTGVTVFGDAATQSTTTGEAVKMLSRLKSKHSRRKAVWIPAFVNSPFTK